MISTRREDFVLRLSTEVFFFLNHILLLGCGRILVPSERHVAGSAIGRTACVVSLSLHCRVSCARRPSHGPISTSVRLDDDIGVGHAATSQHCQNDPATQLRFPHVPTGGAGVAAGRMRADPRRWNLASRGCCYWQCSSVSHRTQTMKFVRWSTLRDRFSPSFCVLIQTCSYKSTFVFVIPFHKNKRREAMTAPINAIPKLIPRPPHPNRHVQTNKTQTDFVYFALNNHSFFCLSKNFTIDQINLFVEIA